MTDGENCGACRWFDRIVERQTGQCKRNAPRPALTDLAARPLQYCTATWPSVSAVEWCGEFERAAISKETP